MMKANNIDAKDNYFRIHHWLTYYHKKPEKCENPECKIDKPSRIEWALIKGKNHERKRENYMALCPSCHRKYDYTEEQRLNMIKLLKGRSVSIQTRKKLSLSNIGKHGGRRIIQKDGYGNIIKIHDNISKAAKDIGILQTSISNMLAGKSKKSGGFIWEYEHQN